ncbi:MAG: glutamate--tRNA ligase family protein [Gemmatimonadales bacterium]
MPPLDLAALPAQPTSRFAPSPTGELHLGHVANAVWTWGLTAALGGRVLLRIEDHDRTRCRPEYERGILADLEWLGLEPAEPTFASFAGPSPFRQSDCDGRYQAALGRLQAAGGVYGCECSRRTIAARVPEVAGEETRYPGICRSKGLAPAAGRGVRVELPDREVSFADGRLGRQSHCPAAQCGDLLLRDQVGNWTYQFSVVVDDLEHGIDLVIRGEDLLSSTGRQLLLGEMLGRPVPARFVHHPLIKDEQGVKLSKRRHSESIASLRATGRSAADVLGQAAHATGLLAVARPVQASELGGLFER